jgi:hypothetical protein
MTTKMQTRADDAPDAAIPTPRFLVKIPGTRDAFGVETLEAASAGFLRVQQRIQEGSGWTKTIRYANVYDPERGGSKRIARISQNGRVWHPTMDVEMVDKTGGAK